MEARSWWFGSGVGSETGYFTVTLLITDTLQVAFMTLADGYDYTRSPEYGPLGIQDAFGIWRRHRLAL
jgi:hypothetical protein